MEPPSTGEKNEHLLPGDASVDEELGEPQRVVEGALESLWRTVTVEVDREPARPAFATVALETAFVLSPVVGDVGGVLEDAQVAGAPCPTRR